MADEEISLGYKGPEEMFNSDLSPVGKLIFPPRLAPPEEAQVIQECSSPHSVESPSPLFPAGHAKRTKTSEVKTRKLFCNRIKNCQQESKVSPNPAPTVILSHEAKKEFLARAMRGEKNQFSYLSLDQKGRDTVLSNGSIKTSEFDVTSKTKQKLFNMNMLSTTNDGSEFQDHFI